MSLRSAPLFPPPPKTIMRFVDGSYTAVWKLRATGEPGAPSGMRFVQTGGPPRPFAFERVHVALLAWHVPFTKPPPPTTVIRLVEGSYTAVGASGPAGKPPAVLSRVQAGVPPSPLALLSTQTSEKVEQPDPPPFCPAKIIIEFEPGS